MLEIRVANQEEINIIKKLIKESQLKIEGIEDYISNCMIAYDQKKAVAAAGFIKTENVAIIKFVVVSKNRQKEYLGDGIVKATLNLADKKGVKRVFVNADKEEIFFVKVGFKDVILEEVKKCCEDIDILNELDGNKILQVILPDYFLKACKSHK
ncbi:GNAT family N-acetyltransferase [Crassaminicella profunda]|uniref:GNAT family N-acetyltransferase n=1 Tax=Crassaminicella profunda TaxID=1286698 RepID=UPI001CA717D4|nr:GNAT family N-acetyltransferase [Crassaminicella profunda]QZY56879.1 GNAT family N-acetyltransferase [Crassaminicella profunda]